MKIEISLIKMLMKISWYHFSVQFWSSLSVLSLSHARSLSPISSAGAAPSLCLCASLPCLEYSGVVSLFSLASIYPYLLIAIVCYIKIYVNLKLYKCHTSLSNGFSCLISVISCNVFLL